MKTNIIIFSKNRTLQLKSLLLSLRHYSDVPEENIIVIYKTDPEISYEPLREQFACSFIEQCDFLKDVQIAVYGNDSDYVWFMVDDLIYRDSFSLGTIEKFLDEHKDVDSFCLRLGKNIKKGRQPQFLSEKDGICIWNTAEDQGKYWNYFWELCSSFYRRELVIEYLQKCRPERETFPNPFEFHYYACMPTTRISGMVKIINNIRFMFRKKSARVACFDKSKCFIHGINLVAELDDKREETYNVKELHQKMLDGYIIDFKSMNDVELDTPSPGHEYFKMIKETTKEI